MRATTCLLSLLCFALPVFSAPVVFEHVLIDKDAIGHREVGDVNGVGFDDIVAVNYPMLVWYEYPNWERHCSV